MKQVKKPVSLSQLKIFTNFMSSSLSQLQKVVTHFDWNGMPQIYLSYASGLVKIN